MHMGISERTVAEVFSQLSGSSSSYKLYSMGEKVFLCVDGLMHSLRRS
jgi:hypothetical protein